MKKSRVFIAIIVALVVTCGVLTAGWIGSNSQSNMYASKLEGGYQKAFSGLVTNINDIEINMSKALVSVDDDKKQELYQKINQLCTLCGTNLGNLPVNHQSIVETTKFINQLGGFSFYLAQKLKSGDSMSSADTQSINDLYNWCVYVQKVVNEYANNTDGSFNILNSTNMGDVNSDFDKMFSNTSATGTEFPTLIYDGPFSDSIKHKQIKGLDNFVIDVKEATKIVGEAFKEYNIKNLKYTGMVTANFEAYHFTFDTAHRHYFVDVTKKGGLLLSASSSGNLAKTDITLKQAQQEAENFAKQLGLENIKSVWGTELSGVAYINLAPVVNNVIIYPDMIKAKISLDTGSVIGWEAQSYAYNHNQRKDFNFVVNQQTAQNMVSKQLNILSIKKCIIPQEYGTEQLCYEFMCTYNNYTYYVYISAKTGLEVNTLRVIKTSNGNLLY